MASQVALRPGKRRALDKSNPIDALKDTLKQLKASVRAKVEHPFRVVKRQFGYVKVRYRGLAENTAQLASGQIPECDPTGPKRRVEHATFIELRTSDARKMQVECSNGCAQSKRGLCRPS